jgi:hypothetical protein
MQEQVVRIMRLSLLVDLDRPDSANMPHFFRTIKTLELKAAQLEAIRSSLEDVSDPTHERRRLNELDQNETVVGRATAEEIEVQFIALWYQETLGHVRNICPSKKGNSYTVPPHNPKV